MRSSIRTLRHPWSSVKSFRFCRYLSSLHLYIAGIGANAIPLGPRAGELGTEIRIVVELATFRCKIALPEKANSLYKRRFLESETASFGLLVPGWDEHRCFLSPLYS